MEILSLLLKCTLTMSVITLLYATLLPILSKRYAPKWRYIIWLVIAFGWLVPFRPLIELPLLPAKSVLTQTTPIQPPYVPNTVNNTAIAISPTPAPQGHSPQISIWTILFFVWLTGIIIILVYHIIRHRSFIRMVNRWSETITSSEIIDLLDILKKEQGIKTPIQCRLCPCISSPMMIGFFQPVILMPPMQLSDDELTFVLRHELTHFKRHDLWYKLMVLGATILHWFNPIVYLMARATSLQCEISCDAYILQNQNIQLRKQYGETIIAVVRGGRTHHTALSTNFYGGKRGMKNRITSILDSKRKKTGIAILCIVLAGIMLTGATLVTAKGESSTIPNTAFTQEEYDKLLSLRFNGYEDMTVSEFQQKAWEARDTFEDIKLLDRFYHDDQLDAMKDTNDIASFLFYELTPLTAKDWESRYFSGANWSNYDNADNASFEYTSTLKITNANSLTVKEYSKAREGVMSGLSKFFKARKDHELQDEGFMIKSIEAEIDHLTKTWSNDALSIQIDYYFSPLVFHENHEESVDSDYVKEREYPYATMEDYRSLLELKTKGYENRPLDEFNEDLLDWANRNFENLQRIDNDIIWNDFAVSLTPEELSFINLTFNLSGNENAQKIKSLYSGVEADPSFGTSRLVKDKSDTGELVWCQLYYQMSYHIPDKSKITVGERDRCVGGVINGIQKFWDETSLEDLLTMSKEDVSKILQDLAKQYSNDLITINFDPTGNWFNFEHLDERDRQDELFGY